MKNAVILHGTDFVKDKNQRNNNWFPWLKNKLEDKNYHVILEELPQAWRPDIDNYWSFINKSVDLNNETILIGHSSGASAILGLLNKLPDNFTIDKAILVGAFIKDRGWNCERLFKEDLDWNKIRNSVKNVYIIHSDNDPYCPLEEAEEIAKNLDTKVILMKGQKHFSVGTMGQKYKKFPELLEYL